jgi:hypothetical protein
MDRSRRVNIDGQNEALTVTLRDMTGTSLSHPAGSTLSCMLCSRSPRCYVDKSTATFVWR